MHWGHDKALDIEPDLAEAHLGRGYAFADLKRYDEALKAFDRALILKPELTDAEAGRLHAKINLCDWTDLSAECERLMASERSTDKSVTPFLFLGVSNLSRDLMKNAELWIAGKFPAVAEPTWRGGTYKHDKIRVAYVSSDFRQHAIGFLVVGIMNLTTNRDLRFLRISTWPGDGSQTRNRLVQSFDAFIDASAFSDQDVALWVRKKRSIC